MNQNVVYLWLFLVGTTIFAGLVSTKIFLVLLGGFVVYNVWVILYAFVNQRKFARQPTGFVKITIQKD